MKLLKSKIIAITLFMVLWICFSANSQQAGSGQLSYAPPEIKSHRLDVSSSFSYYPSAFYARRNKRFNFQADTIAPVAPAEYEIEDSYNLNLQMGLRLFRNWQAHVDFGIEDENVQRSIDFMAKIGVQYFDIQLDYTMFNRKIHLWEDTPFGKEAAKAILDRQADSLVDYNQTWMNVALMLRPYYAWKVMDKTLSFERYDEKRARELGHRNFKSAAAYSYFVGLFYNRATIPMLAASEVMEVNETNMPADGAIAELDPQVAVWAVGPRFGFGMDHNSAYRPPGSKLTYAAVFDVGFGKGEPDVEIIERMKNLNPEFESSFFCFYARIKLVWGIYHEFKILNDLIFHLEGGVDINTQRYLLFSEYYLTPHWINIGPYIRLGLRF